MQKGKIAREMERERELEPAHVFLTYAGSAVAWHEQVRIL